MDNNDTIISKLIESAINILLVAKYFMKHKGWTPERMNESLYEVFEIVEERRETDKCVSQSS